MLKFKKHIGFRLDNQTYEIVDKVCAARQEKMSGFVRRALLKELARLSYLTPEEKKALEIKEEEEGIENKRCSQKNKIYLRLGCLGDGWSYV